MNRYFASIKIKRAIYALELVLAVLVIFGVIVGITDILRYFPKILFTDIPESYDVFKDFLGHILLVVMGVEMVLMLVSHEKSAMLDLVLYVIARKMLIYGETSMDMLLGTVSVAILYFVNRYFNTDEHADDASFLEKLAQTAQTIKGEPKVDDKQED